MTKKQLLVGALILAVAVLVYMKVGRDKEGMEGDMKETGESDDTSGTQGDGVVVYKCDGNKSFTLSSVDADTIRVSGPGVTTANLDETSQGTGYWANASGKTTVKTVGDYVVLVQNDLVTHDRCGLK